MKILVYIMTTLIFLPFFGICMFIPILNIFLIKKIFGDNL